MGNKFGLNVVIGIPSFGMVSTYFMQGRLSQMFPLVSSAIDKIVLNKPIADARNEIVQYALDQGANYIYWLDDDVVAPPDAFLKLFNQQKDIINGVYWSKSNPPMPLLFRGHMDGPYYNWHVGDLIEIDAAGNGLTLVKTDVYRKIEKEIGGPWYSTRYGSFAGVTESPQNNTEDLYFYWKAKRAGYKIWADTSVQAFHYEKNQNIMYGIPANAPQNYKDWEILPEGSKLIADVGAGPVSPYMRDEGKVISFDIREDCKPTVVCDVRRLPVPDQTFDIVYSSHTLEHFAFNDVQKVLSEWCRTLRVGGELRLIVPNLRHVGYRMVVDQMLPTDYWVLYGEQEYAKNFHAAGFTPRSLALLVESLGCFKDIETSEGDVFGDLNNINWSIQLRAKKISHPVIDNIVPENIPPAPASPAWWPMAIYPTYNERPMTEEEIKNDVRYNVAAKQSPKKFDFIGKPEERMWGPIPQDWVEPVEKVEEKDSGMDSEATIDEQKPEKKRRVSSRKTPRST
jgi:predicted SAM-dependent methyltransferase